MRVVEAWDELGKEERRKGGVGETQMRRRGRKRFEDEWDGRSFRGRSGRGEDE